MLRRAVLSTIALGACLGAVACKRSQPSEASASASASALPSALEAPRPSRCDEPRAGSAFSLGEQKATDDSDPLPFAVQVGDGAAFDGGFAVGVLVPNGRRGAQASVVTLGPDGAGARVVSLGTAHGDTPTPRVAAAGKGLVAALLESGPNGRRLKLARVEGDQVTWGPGFDQGRDESLAFDLAVGPSRGVVAWDDDAKDPERGVVRVSSFLVESLGSPTPPRVVSPKTSDAEMPRLVKRPGGFWITWIGRRPEKIDDEGREVGQEPEFRWLEAMPLDEAGVPVGSTRRVTPEKGHVLVYDVEEGEGGNATVVYRDDDTPSGSDGGVLLKVVLRPDGASEPEVLADRSLGVGAPALSPGWLAMADAASETRLARVGPGGLLQDKLEPEPVLGRGEPIASRGDSLLVVRPTGLGVRMFVTRCGAVGQPRPASGEPAPPQVPPADPPVLVP